MAHNHHFGDISGGGGNVIAPVEAPEDAAAQEVQAVQAVQAVPAAQEVQAAQVAQVAAREAPEPVQAVNVPPVAPLVLPPIIQAAPAVEEMRGFYAVLPVAQANQSVQIHAAAPVAAAFGAAAAAAAAAVAHPGASNVLAVPVAYHSAAHHSVNFMAAPVQVQARPSLWEAPRHQDGHNYAWGPTLPEYVNYNNNNKRFLAAATYAAAGNGGNHNNNNNNAEDLTTEMTEVGLTKSDIFQCIDQPLKILFKSLFLLHLFSQEKKRQKEEQAELTNCIAAKRLKTDPELEEALSSGKLSDVLLRFPDSSETIPAHRLMLAKGSPTFEAMFSTDMVEKLKGEVLLQDVRPEVMRLVLRFLYNAKPLEQEELQMHAVELYKAGHMVRRIDEDDDDDKLFYHC